MKKGEFKSWVAVTYQAYLYEHDAYNEPHNSLNQYWEEYKWWLRQEFRKNQEKEKRAVECRAKYNQIGY